MINSIVFCHEFSFLHLIDNVKSGLYLCLQLRGHLLPFQILLLFQVELRQQVLAHTLPELGVLLGDALLEDLLYLLLRLTRFIRINIFLLFIYGVEQDVEEEVLWLAELIKADYFQEMQGQVVLTDQKGEELGEVCDLADIELG